MSLTAQTDDVTCGTRDVDLHTHGYVHFQGNGLKYHVGSKLLDFILCLFLLVCSCYMVRNIFVFKILFKNVYDMKGLVSLLTTWYQQEV